MKKRNWFWGLFFILSGAFVIFSQTDLFGTIGIVSVIVTIALVALFISSLAHREVVGMIFPLAFLYMIYQKPLGWPKVSWWVPLLAALFLSIGLSLLFRRKKPKTPCFYSEGEPVVIENQESVNGDNVYGKANFSGSTKYIHSQNLRSGHFDVSFGSLEIYFDSAKLSPEGATVEINCSFGGMTLYVPKTWRVIDNTHVSLGGVSNENRFASPSPDAPPLILVGNVSFSGIEVRYI